MRVSERLEDFERPSKQSPQGNFFQSVEFYHVLKKAKLNPFVLTVCDRECVSGLLAYEERGWESAHYLRHFRNIIHMRHFRKVKVLYGPIVTQKANSNALDVLLAKLDSKQGILEVDVRAPFPPWVFDDAFRRNGYYRQDLGGEHSVVIDLTKDENILWKEMRESTRRNIKKAIQRNVKIEEVSDEQGLRRFYQIYLHTAQRNNFVPYSYIFFHALKSLQSKGLTKFFLVWHHKKAIAGILNTVYNGESIYYIGGSLREHWALRPNHLLFWHSIQWSKMEAKAQTYKLYYLLKPRRQKTGAQRDWHTFKTSFGGDIIHERTFYLKVISPIKLLILKSGRRLLQATRLTRLL